MLSAVSRFMVTSQQEYRIWKLDLQSEQIRNDLWLVLTSINVITHKEKLLLVLSELLLPKHFNQVKVLTMNVANHEDFALYAKQVRLVS